MKRRLVKLVVFLLLGATVNVAVAWGLVWSDPRERVDGFWHGGGASHSEWRKWECISFGAHYAFGRGRASCSWDGPDARRWRSFLHEIDDRPLESIVASWAQEVLPREGDSPTAVLKRIVDMRGWPNWSLASRYESKWETTLNAKPMIEEQLISCVRIPDRKNKFGWDASAPRLLPLCPIWPGFAVNTVFYAVILWVLWWGLFAAPFALRRRRRMRRGLCPACAYDLRGSASQECPECGKPVPLSLRERLRVREATK